MRHLHRANLIRLAMIPALAAGVSVSAQSQTEPADARSSTKPAATAVENSPSADYRGERASETIGQTVRNLEDEDIGKINDMIVDMTTGDVRYAILEFDPGIFQAEKLFAVPTTELRLAADGDDVIYDMSEEQLERASMNRDDWNDSVLDDPDYLADLDTVWGVKQPASGATAHRASDLIGKDVNDRSGDKIGEIEELVINMAEQQVHYAVLKFDPGWATPEQNYAFPLRSFNLTGDRDELVLDIDKSKLQAMKSFPDSRYSNLSDRAWVADIDRDFVTGMPTASTAAGALNAGYAENPAPTELFTRLDKDGDGSLEKADVENIAEVENAWSRFDEDGDGRISRQEFMNNYPTEAAATPGTAGTAGTSGATDAPEKATDATASPVER